MKISDMKKQFEQEGFECFYQARQKKNFNIFIRTPGGRISIGEYRSEVDTFKICNSSQLYITETNESLMNERSLNFGICFFNEVMFEKIESALKSAKKLEVEYKKLQERIELIKIAMDSL
jgi:hypothetical protein